MSTPKPESKLRFNPMELKRQRMAKRRKEEGSQSLEQSGSAASQPAESAPSAASEKDVALEDKLKSIYAKARLDGPLKRRVLQVPVSLTTHERIPMDWTLKSKLVCSTPFRFPRRSNASSTTSALRYFVQSSLRNSIPSTSPSDRWNAALHQYVHPATPQVVDPATTTTMDDESSLLRLRSWQEAFRSAYFTFHHDRHDSLYVATPQSVVCFFRVSAERDGPASFRHLIPQLTVLSSNSSTLPLGLRNGVAVVISHATSTFRRELNNLGVDFILPFTSGAVESTGIPDKRQDTIDMKSNQVIRGPDSLLLTQGPNHVHGVFDLLLNQPGILASTDVPLVCARFPFQNASIVPLQVIPRGKVISSNGSADAFKIEVCGCILPNTMELLITALRDEAESTFSIVVEPWHASTRLNICGWACDVGNIDLLRHPDEIECMKRYVNAIHWDVSSGYLVGLNKS
ncbi:hypothetical protein AeRB84_004236 [Aphanomyces euteiches]|nr:hypothetical protein AeRB84_004236 [Aphanomyces euteiches]